MAQNISLVSVIIPTYNRDAYIEDSINSVLKQKGHDQTYEIIVVDDGSTDGTEELLSTYRDKIRYYRIKHSGLPAVARNFGIRKARGELVAFQDSDDLWVPEKLSLQTRVFEDKLVALSYGNAKIMDKAGKPSAKTVIPPGSGKSGNIFEQLLDVNFISTLTVMARRAVILESGGFNESLSLRGVEDYELWLRLSTKGRFVFIDKPLAIHRRHDENISHSIKFQNNEHIMAVYKSILRTDLTAEQKAQVREKIHQLLTSRQDKLSGKDALVNKLQIFSNKVRAR